MEKQGRFVMVMNEIAESNHLQAAEEDCEEGAAIMAPAKDIRKDACFWWTISTLKEKQRATLESFLLGPSLTNDSGKSSFKHNIAQ